MSSNAMRVSLGRHGQNLLLRNPLIAGPGTVGYGREHLKSLPIERLGAIVTNTTTLHHRAGSLQPRLSETPAGVIMSTGLQNPGLRTVLRRHAIAWGRMRSPVILSLAAEDAETFASCVELASESDSVAALQLEPDLLAAGADMVRVLGVVRSITTLPLIVRLPVASPQAVADAIVDLAAVGCDAVVIGSPWPGLAMDSEDARPLLAGGVSGPAVRPLALRLVFDTVQLLEPDHLPLIACGGICSPADVAAFLAAGAAAVMLDTVIYSDPAAVAAMADMVDARRQSPRDG